MKNNIINKLQFCSMFILLNVAPFLGTGIYLLIRKVKIDAYISVIIGSILSILIVFIFLKILNYEPSLPINKKINKLFGQKLGFIINLICIISLFIIGIFTMFNLTNFIVSQFLSETPLYIIGILFSLVIIYINIKGIETLSRTSLILLIINLILTTIAFLELTTQFDISNLKPVLEHGLKNPLIGALYFVTLNINPLLILLIIPKDSIIANEKIKKWIIITYIITVIIMFLFLFFTLSTLGIHLASIYQYPEYMVLKKLTLFNFLDRIENIIVIQWIFGLYTLLSCIVYYISNSIKFENKSKLLPILITLSILITSLIVFKNNTMFNELSYNFLPIIRFVILVILIIIFLKIIFTKEKNNML